ncbi:hypothetical protein Mal15_39060 [Stieleria maiorica]|uniref:Uncharacterized protein n=1 Tax=Stieleria maiorica TaxID=2795974 RepID=A0A5B9MH58_9BACT|nr:hypothetical protein [Stieleria maiorica]QEF99839.1 hypothetical protein Mal15_39060 [Stieleria maiorica]
MQSARFRLIICVAATVLNLLLVGLGHYLFGPVAALGFGATFGIAIFEAVVWIFRRGNTRRSERRIMTAVIVVATVTGIFIGWDSYRNGLHDTRARVREANRLRSQLQDQPQFDLVILSYHAPPLQSEERLSVHGYVSSPQDLDSLQQMVYKDREWKVEWNVGLMSDRPSKRSTANEPAVQ